MSTNRHVEGERTGMNIYARISELTVAEMRSRLAVLYQFVRLSTRVDEQEISKVSAAHLEDIILGSDAPVAIYLPGGDYHAPVKE